MKKTSSTKQRRFVSIVANHSSFRREIQVMEREIQTNSTERLNTAISYAALVLGLLNSNQFNTWRQMHTTGMNAEVSQNRKNFDAALQSYTLYIARKVILI